MTFLFQSISLVLLGLYHGAYYPTGSGVFVGLSGGSGSGSLPPPPPPPPLGGTGVSAGPGVNVGRGVKVGVTGGAGIYKN